MRWPWSRDRERPPETPPAAVRRTPAAEPAPSPMGWAFLPPVQRTLSEPISTMTRPATFPGSLPAWTNPSFSGPLRHVVSDQAPAGVIDAGGLGGTSSLGAPVQRVAAGVDLALPPPAPVRRSPAAVVPGAATDTEAPSPAPEGSSDPPGPAETLTDPDPAPVLDHVAPVQPTIQRATVASTRTALTTAPVVGLPVARPRVLDEPPPDLVVARTRDETASPATSATTTAAPPTVLDLTPPASPGRTSPATTDPAMTDPAATDPAATDAAPRSGDVDRPVLGGTPAPVVSRAAQGPVPTAAPATPSTPATPATPATPVAAAPRAAGPVAETRPTPVDLPVATQRSVDPVQAASSGAGAGAGPQVDPADQPGQSGDEVPAEPQGPVPDAPSGPAPETPLLGEGPSPSTLVQRSTATAASPDAPNPSARGRSGFGAPLASAPDTVSDLPVPLLQRSQAHGQPWMSTPVGTSTPPAPGVPAPPAPAQSPRSTIGLPLQRDLAADARPGADGHTEVVLPTTDAVPATDALGTMAPLVPHAAMETLASPTPAPTGPTRSDPGQGPASASAPLPLPVLARSATTTAPLGPMATSLSRAASLPGPGTPSQTLEVRPARTLLGPPPGGPVVTAQRVLSSMQATPSGPPTPSAVASATPSEPVAPTSGTPARPRGPGPSSPMPIQRAVSISDLTTSAAAPAAEPVEPAAPPEAPPESATGPAGPVPVTGTTTNGAVAGVPGPSAPGRTVSATRPGADPGGADASGSDEIEALAQRLTQPLLRRLTSQLLVDRERRGVRTDPW